MPPKKKSSAVFATGKKSTKGPTTRSKNQTSSSKAKHSEPDPPPSNTPKESYARGSQSSNEGSSELSSSPQSLDKEDALYGCEETSENIDPLSGEDEDYEEATRVEEIVKPRGKRSKKARTTLPKTPLLVEETSKTPFWNPPLALAEVNGRARNLQEFQNVHEEVAEFLLDGKNLQHLRALNGKVTNDQRPINVNIGLHSFANLRLVYAREPIRSLQSTIHGHGKEESLLVFPAGVHTTEAMKDGNYMKIEFLWFSDYERADLEVVCQWLAAFLARYPTPLNEVTLERSVRHAIIVAAIVSASLFAEIPSSLVPALGAPVKGSNPPAMRTTKKALYHGIKWNETQVALIAILSNPKKVATFAEFESFDIKFFPGRTATQGSLRSNIRTRFSKNAKLVGEAFKPGPEYPRSMPKYRFTIAPNSMTEAVALLKTFNDALANPGPHVIVPAVISMPQLIFHIDRGNLVLTLQVVTHDPITGIWQDRGITIKVKYVRTDVTIPKVADYYRWDYRNEEYSEQQKAYLKAILHDGNLDHLPPDFRDKATDEQILRTIELGKYLQTTFHGMFLENKDYFGRRHSIIERFMKRGYSAPFFARDPDRAVSSLYPGPQAGSLWILRKVVVDNIAQTSVRLRLAALRDIEVEASARSVVIFIPSRNHARILPALEAGLQMWLRGGDIWQAFMEIARQADLEATMRNNDEVSLPVLDRTEDEKSGAYHVCIGCLTAQPYNEFTWSEALQVDLCAQPRCSNLATLEEDSFQEGGDEFSRVFGIERAFRENLMMEARHLGIDHRSPEFRDMLKTVWPLFRAKHSENAAGTFWRDEYVSRGGDESAIPLMNLCPATSVGSGFFTSGGHEFDVRAASFEARDPFWRDPDVRATFYHDFFGVNTTITNTSINLLKGPSPRLALYAIKEICRCNRTLAALSSVSGNETTTKNVQKERDHFVEMVGNISVSNLSVGRYQNNRIGMTISEEDMDSFSLNWTRNVPLPRHLLPKSSKPFRLLKLNTAHFRPHAKDLEWLLRVLKEAAKKLGFKGEYLWMGIVFPFSESAKQHISKEDWTWEYVYVYFNHKLYVMKRECNRYWWTICTTTILIATVTICFMKGGQDFIGLDIWPFVSTIFSGSVGKVHHAMAMLTGWTGPDGEPTTTPEGFDDFVNEVCNIEWGSWGSNNYKRDFDERQYPDMLGFIDKIFPPEQLLGVPASDIQVWNWRDLKYSDGTDDEVTLPDVAALDVCPFEDVPESDEAENPSDEAEDSTYEADDQSDESDDSSDQDISISNENDDVAESAVKAKLRDATLAIIAVRVAAIKAGAPSVPTSAATNAGANQLASNQLAAKQTATNQVAAKVTAGTAALAKQATVSTADQQVATKEAALKRVKAQTAAGNAAVLDGVPQGPNWNRTRGFANPALFCYQNSACHTLFGIEPIRDRILDIVVPEENTDSQPLELRVRLEVIRQLQTVLRRLGAQSIVSIDPRLLGQACFLIQSKFDGQKNEDPYEFFGFLMDIFHQVEGFIEAGEWREWDNRVDHALLVKSTDHYECTKCGYGGDSRAQEALGLSLGLPDDLMTTTSDESRTLDSLLDMFGNTEIVEYICENDNLTGEELANHTQRRSTTTLTRLPPYLVISIKRYRFNARGEKMRTTVPNELKLTLLNALPITLRQSPDQEHEPNYELISQIQHLGEDLNGGHYVSYQRTGKRGAEDEWTRFDDMNHVRPYARISPADKDQLEGDVYMLVYKQRSVNNRPKPAEKPSAVQNLAAPPAGDDEASKQIQAPVQVDEEPGTEADLANDEAEMANPPEKLNITGEEPDPLVALAQIRAILAQFSGASMVPLALLVNDELVTGLPDASLARYVSKAQTELTRRLPESSLDDNTSTVDQTLSHNIGNDSIHENSTNKFEELVDRVEEQGSIKEFGLNVSRSLRYRIPVTEIVEYAKYSVEGLTSCIPNADMLDYASHIIRDLREMMPDDSIDEYTKLVQQDLCQHNDTELLQDTILDTMGDTDMPDAEERRQDYFANRRERIRMREIDDTPRPRTPPLQSAIYGYSNAEESKENRPPGSKRARNLRFDEDYVTTPTTPRAGRASRSAKRPADISQLYNRSMMLTPPKFPGFKTLLGPIGTPSISSSKEDEAEQDPEARPADKSAEEVDEEGLLLMINEETDEDDPFA